MRGNKGALNEFPDYSYGVSKTDASKQLTSLVTKGVLFSSLFIETWILINPANLERLVVLYLFLGGLIGVAISKSFSESFKIPRISFIFLCCLAIWSIIVIKFSEREFFQQIYGEFGRNSGFALYFGLATLALLIFSTKSIDLVPELTKKLVVAGLISTGYGILQHFNLDILGWESGGEITGLFGNSNFQSSFLGISSISILALILFPVSFTLNRWVLAAILCLSLWNIYESNSIQGFFVFIIGVLVLIYFKIVESHFSKFKYLYAVLVGFIGTLTSFGLVGLGPFAQFLTFQTIAIREYYWKAGLGMIKNSPVFGSGYDAYGDLYRQFRKEDSIVDFGPELVSTAAHNVYIDLAVNGGLPLLLAYGFLVVLTLQRTIKVFRRQSIINPFHVALFASWIGYLAQLFVSMNQVSIAIWGWAIMGALLGYERLTRVALSEDKSKGSSKKVKEFGLDPILTVRFIGGAVVGLLLISPPFLSEAKFRSALESSDGKKIEQAALAWPRNPVFMVKATEIFRDNNLEDMSVKMATRTVREFPTSIYGWRTLLTLSNLNPKLQDTATTRLHLLDPLNPNYK
jgi:O-antigen ligase